MVKKFDILKKKNLPDEARIVGFTFLKEPTEKDKEKKKFDFIEKSNSNEIGCMLSKRSSWAYTKGYVKIDNRPETFVEVKSRLLIIIILLFGWLLGAMLLFGGKDGSMIPEFPSIGNFDIVDDPIVKPTEKPTEDDEYTEEELRPYFDRAFEEEILPPVNHGKSFILDNLGKIYSLTLHKEEVMQKLQS